MTMTMTMLITMMMVVVFLPESSATHRTPGTEGGRGSSSHQTPKLSEPVVISCSSCKNHSLDLRRVNSDKTCSKLSNSGKDSADPIVALVSRIWALKGKIFKCNQCSITYKSAYNLKLHVDRDHKGNRSFRCELCDET